jgi:TetR/AcrR family transcriptional regulator, cholesterol catabolism regulator
MREVPTRRFRDNLQEKRQSEIQEEVLRVAARLFAQHGYRAVTIDMISEDMGYSKSSIYYYFKNKEEILWRVFDSIYATYLSAAERARAESQDAVETMRRLIRQHIKTVVEHHDWTTIFFQNEGELSKERQRLIRSRKRAYNQILEGVYAEGVKALVFRDIPPHIAVNGILGMCNSVFVWYDELRTANLDQVADYFVSLLAHGYQLSHANTS